MSVMGLDLSLRQTGLVILPDGWVPASWDTVVTHVFGMELKSFESEIRRMERLLMIARGILSLVKQHDVTHVFSEGYSFGRVQRAHHLGELGGVVKSQLWLTNHLITTPVPVSAARRAMFGKVKRQKDVKRFVREKLRGVGACFGTQDEYDAFVIANYGLAALGKQHLTMQGGLALEGAGNARSEPGFPVRKRRRSHSLRSDSEG